MQGLDRQSVWPRVRLSRGLLGLALGSIATLALSFGTAAARADDRPVVIARSMDLTTLDPQRGLCDTCQIYYTAVYETLIGIGLDNETLQPRLAKSWESNADQTVFTFHLDSAAKFSDGSPVEAKDVKWSFERLINLKGPAAFFLDGVKSIDTPDAHTVVVTMGAPNSEFFGILTSSFTGITNSDVATAQGASAGADGATADKAEEWFIANSAGSGPFVLESYKPDDELRLARNPNYWRDPAGVSGVVMRQVKDAVAQAQALQSGDADIGMQIESETAKTITSDQVTVRSAPSWNFVYVTLGPGAKDNTVPLTPEVREAIASALDYEGILQFTVGGAGRLQASPIPNGFPGSEGLPLPKRDLDKARALLAKAGVADGFEMKAIFPNLNVYGIDLSQLMQKVAQDLAEVNIKVTLEPTTLSLWREKINSDGVPMAALWFGPDYLGSAEYVHYFSMMPGSTWSKRTKEDLADPHDEELLNQALAAAPGEAQANFYNELGHQMINERIILPLVNPDVTLAHSSSLDGVHYSVCCILLLDKLKWKN